MCQGRPTGVIVAPGAAIPDPECPCRRPDGNPRPDRTQGCGGNVKCKAQTPIPTRVNSFRPLKSNPDGYNMQGTNCLYYVPMTPEDVLFQIRCAYQLAVAAGEAE